MRSASQRALVLALLLGASSPAMAASVSDEGAQDLAKAFATYVGQPALDKGYVKVEAGDDDYTVTIDIPKMVEGLPADKATVEAGPIELHTQPQDDGTWKVTADSLPTVKLVQKKPEGEETFDFAAEGYTFEGVYDPKVAAFLTGSAKIDKMSFSSTSPQGTVEAVYGPSTATVTGTPNGDGSVSLQMHQTLESLSETVTVTGESPVRFVVKTGEIKADVQADSAKGKGLLDIVAFFVANPERKTVSAEELPSLKSRLSAALPLWNGLNGNVVINDVAVETPFGPFKVATLTETIGVSGLAREGFYDMGLKLAGFSMPDGLLPGWTKSVVPTDADISARVGGIDLDTVAHMAIDKLQPGGSDPWPPEVKDQLAGYFVNGPLRLTLKPGSVTSPSLTLGVEGDMSILPQPVEARVIVTADGLDKVMADLQTSTDQDPNKQQALMMMGMAKALAKPGDGGKSVWTVEMMKDGSVSVNGQQLKPPSGP